MVNVENPLATVVVGQRIEYNNEFGTVKYIGEVKNHKGIWFGVDWDNPHRGKNKGFVDGEHYFTAKSDKSGSFIRPHKVNLGCSLLDSITSRYGFIGTKSDVKYQEDQISQVQSILNAPFLELVGFDKVTEKQSNYDKLIVISARNQLINFLGEPGEFYNLCPNVAELDLSKNLLHSAAHFFRFCSEMLHLKWIKISENIMNFSHCDTFVITHLNVLVCGEMNLTWNNLKTIGSICLNLEELIAPRNLIDRIALEKDDKITFKNLKVLDLEGNLISSWGCINNLRHLPHLHTMNLSGMKLTSIDIKNATDFVSLRKILIKDNLISDWKSISNLNNLAKLNALSISNCTLYNKGTMPSINQVLIAMIEGLEYLNGSDIRESRRGAEIDYLKTFGTNWLSVKCDPEKASEFLNVHTRYKDLIEVYGEMDKKELKAEPRTITGTLIEISLNYQGLVLTKKVQPTMLVRRLAMICKRLFHIKDSINLTYVDDHVEFELEENKDLCSYSISSSSTILVKT